MVSEISGRIASSTTLEFNRATDETSTVNITWDVVEYNCGITVQRGSVAQSGTTNNVTITPVPALSQAFVTWSKTPGSSDASFGDNDWVLGELTSTSNLQFRTNVANAAHTIWWQVVSFDDSSKISVQRGTTSLTGAATSATTTITAVNTAHAFVLTGIRATGTGTDIGSGAIRARITSSTQVTIDRSVANYDITEISWQVVELKDGSDVQSGSATLASGSASATAGADGRRPHPGDRLRVDPERRRPERRAHGVHRRRHPGRRHGHAGSHLLDPTHHHPQQHRRRGRHRLVRRRVGQPLSPTP